MHIKLLTVFILGFTLLTNAQKYTKSPFSAYGIGEYGGLDNATFSGMGNNSVAIIDSTVLNFNNPSSYASLGAGFPLFSTGVSSKFSSFDSKEGSFNTKYFGIDQFSIGIPFSKRFGIAAGLKPFSRTGYEFYQDEKITDYNMRYIYKGSGGTNEVFAGFAANVMTIKNHKLGIGVNLGYVFGSTNNQRVSYINVDNATTFAGGVDNKGFRLKSVRYDFGMNYQYKIQQNQTLTVAATYSPALKLTAQQNDYLAYSADVTNPTKYDYISISNAKGTISMPSTIGIGFNYALRPNTTKIVRKNVYQLSFNGEFKTTNWSDYRENFNGISSTENFTNTQRVGLGVQFIPHSDFLDRATSINYLSKIRYRAGFQYTTLPLVVQGKQQSDVAVTAGFGFPIPIQRSFSSINIGFTMGKRGNGMETSVNERYIGINFGVTISPGLNDRWFRKFKID